MNEPRLYPVAADTIIYAYDMVVLKDGYARRPKGPWTVGDAEINSQLPLKSALETVDNRGGKAGDKHVRVAFEGDVFEIQTHGTDGSIEKVP